MPARPGARSVHVTPREVEVLDLLVQGLGNAEIGVALGIGTRTVKGHVAKAASRLGVRGDKTGVHILLAKFWQCPIFRLGAGWDDHRLRPSLPVDPLQATGGPSDSRQLWHPHPPCRGGLVCHTPPLSPALHAHVESGERFFAEITDKRIRRGTFRSVGELVRTIRD
jgi:DNA-binding CsgD family transcriptional regulator